MAELDQQILTVLGKAKTPLPISKINAELIDKTPNRTLQRLLMQLVDAGKIVATGNTRSRRYELSVAQSMLNTPDNGGFNFSSVSMPAIEKIRQPMMNREPCTYLTEWLASYIPNQSFYLSASLRQQLMLQGRQVSAGLPAGTYAHQVFSHLLVDLSYNSSRLEGNTYSLPDTRRLLLEGEVAANKPDREKIMLLNHKEAIRFLVDGINRLEITVANICSLHLLLASDLVAPEEVGEVRDGMVRVSSTAYIPMTGQEKLTQQLELITHIARQIHDPFEQSFFLLVHIAYLQAFVDVNKRTARLSCNIPLVKQNLVPLSFNDIEPDDYASAILVVYEQNDVQPLAELYAWSYLRSCKQYAVAVESLHIDPVRAHYRQTRRDIIRQLVQQGMHADIAEQFIQSEVRRIVPVEHQEKVLLDLQFEVERLAPHRIAGMGITQEELAVWLLKNEDNSG